MVQKRYSVHVVHVVPTFFVQMEGEFLVSLWWVRVGLARIPILTAYFQNKNGTRLHSSVCFRLPLTYCFTSQSLPADIICVYLNNYNWTCS